MTEAEIRAELQAILTEAQGRAELIGSVLELLDAERAQTDTEQTQALVEAVADRLERERAILDKRHMIPPGGYVVTLVTPRAWPWSWLDRLCWRVRMWNGRTKRTARRIGCWGD